MPARVGSVTLSNPVMTASGTSGHGAELADYFDLSSLGAVVVKSLSVEPWPGNEAPRVCPVPGGMLNSVGLQGPGIAAWAARDLPSLVRLGARVVVSVWGRRVEDYAAAGSLLASVIGPPSAQPGGVIAVEVNVSCPNLEDGSRMFAHSPEATAAAVRAASRCGLPIWAKLSPNSDALVEVAGAALDAGAEAVTLVNTLSGLAIDIPRRRPALGAGSGGLSGAALHSVALRAVHDCRAAYPDAAIVGVGGIADGAGAFRMLLAGANAVQVGTATLADPRAPWRVLEELSALLEREQVGSVAELVGLAQARGNDSADSRRAGLGLPGLPGRPAGPPADGSGQPEACGGQEPGASGEQQPAAGGERQPEPRGGQQLAAHGERRPGPGGGQRPAARGGQATGSGAPAAVRRRLGLALDLPDLPAALGLARQLAPWFGIAKVGPELFISAGPESVRALVKEGVEVFLDLKLHDIPTTVGRGAMQAGALGATYLTVHAAGGKAMVRAAVEGFARGRRGFAGSTASTRDDPGATGSRRPGVLAVTVLTSEADAPVETLEARGEIAAATGCAGFVCAAGDLGVLRRTLPDLLAVVPGIRLPEASLDDQERTATPGAATRAGAGLLVLGRTVTGAADVADAARRAAAEVEQALR